MNLSSYFHIIRPKNLAIVAISQALIYLLYLNPIKSDTSLVLNGSLWWLFILDTILIAASGYVINDVFDQDADKVNKPERQTLNDEGLSQEQAHRYYWTLTIFGFVIAAYIAFAITKLHLLIIYPVAVGFLYMYSRSWKKKPLVGNFVVAIFCAFVPGIIWYAEHETLGVIKSIEPQTYHFVKSLFIAYISFAFISTLCRELIKDIEDIEGDKSAKYNTAPIALGISFSRMLALFWAILLLLSFGLWSRPFEGTVLYLVSSLVFFGLMLPTGIITWRIKNAQLKFDYTTISKWLKILMIVSLFIFLSIPFINAYFES